MVARPVGMTASVFVDFCKRLLHDAPGPAGDGERPRGVERLQSIAGDLGRCPLPVHSTLLAADADLSAEVVYGGRPS
jgi:hypothetical protein